MNIELKAQKKLRIQTSLPGDKSISHRAIIMAALAQGTSVIRNFLESEDCRNTVKIFKRLGVRIESPQHKTLRVRGQGLYAFKQPKGVLDCGNSGTTMRLLSGLLAAQDFKSKLSGDRSLKQRPMDRVVRPLLLMGAKVKGKGKRQRPPLTIQPSERLLPIRYRLPVASAQVKSAVLLAGLYTPGWTSVMESEPTRDHTERFFKATGIPLISRGHSVRVRGGVAPSPFQIRVPGDISSAAFLIALGLLVPQAHVKLRDILWNHTRIGLIRVLKRMRAKITIRNRHFAFTEPCADIEVKPTSLSATRIARHEIASLIDEIPILMILATQARGTTWIYGAGELRVKETDRIHSMLTGLRQMGAKAGVKGDNIWIKGPCTLKGARVKSFGDHRTAMSFIIAGLIAQGVTRVSNITSIRTSFPNFLQILRKSGCRYLIR